MSDSPYIFEGTADNFEALVIQGSHEAPVLVDFWADWCNPCQMLMPIVTALAESYQGKFRLVKVNSDEQQPLAGQYGVRSLPTLKLFQNGQVVEEIMGAQSEPVLRELLDKYISRESDPLLAQAMQLAETGDLNQARTLLHQAQQNDPDNQNIALDLARLSVMSGDFENAEIMLNALPAAQRESLPAIELQAQLQFAKTIQGSPTPEALQTLVENDPADLQSRYLLAAWRALEGDYTATLEQYLSIMKQDRSWQDEAGRKGMLGIFELLGSENELVGKYRRQLFNLLH